MNAVVYPASGSPKNIGPPDALAADGGKFCACGETGEMEDGTDDGKGVVREGGSVSQERVRRQAARRREKDAVLNGSCADV